MPAKVSEKKTTKSTQKPAKKTVKKNAKKLTWADIQEGFDKLQKSQDETWAAIRDIQKYIDGNKPILDETWQSIGDDQKNVGGLKNTLDSLCEHLYSYTLLQKFKQLGLSFDRIVTYRSAEGIYAEIHAMLESRTQAMVVDIEHTLCITDIDEHLERMEKIRKYADEHGDKRQFMGAIAATITDKSTREYALKNGLFVIEPSGENVKVTKPEGDVRVW